MYIYTVVVAKLEPCSLVSPLAKTRHPRLVEAPKCLGVEKRLVKQHPRIIYDFGVFRIYVDYEGHMHNRCTNEIMSRR